MLSIDEEGLMAIAQIAAALIEPSMVVLLLCLHVVGHARFLMRAFRHQRSVLPSQLVIRVLGGLIYVFMIASVLNLVALHQLAFLVGLMFGIWVSVYKFYLLLFRIETSSRVEP